MLSEKMIRLLKKIGWILALLTAFVLGIKQLREPDIWWMLRTGDWILQHGRVMKEDVFSFTFQGVEWLNVKWGFELILLWLNRIGGPEITLLLQSVVNVLILVFINKVYKKIRETDVLPKKRYFPTFSIIVGAYLLLLACEFRFNGRPEMVSHIMTAVYLFILLSWRFSPSHKIYLLIPLQILWVNLHEAYGTGMVMMIAMLGATWFEYLFLFKDNNNSTGLNQAGKPLHLTFAVLIAILASAVHPWGLRMIIHPYEIFTQVQENKFTTELLSFTEKGYWQKEAYINIAVFVFGLLSFLFRFSPKAAAPKNSIKKAKPKWYLQTISRFSLGYIAFFFMFFYLSLTAYRNIPFFIIIATPIVAIGLDNIIRFIGWKLEKKGRSKKVKNSRSLVYVFTFVAGILIYIFVASGSFYKTLDDGRDQYGLKVNPVMHPVGAAYLIADNDIGGRCFSDFLVSNYLLWQLRPDFKTFIDLRDLDVFTADFFNQFAYLLYEPQKFDALDSQYNFNYAVLNRTNFQTLHKYIANHRNWVLAYADPVAAVYLKRNAENNSVIRKYSLFNPQKDVFADVMEWDNTKTAAFISKLFWPGYNPKKEIEYNIDLFAADFYKTIGKNKLALNRAKKASQNKSFENWRGDEMTGNILYEKAATDTGLVKAESLSQAANAFNSALAKNKNAEEALLGLGKIKMEQQDWQGATDYFNSALKINPGNINTYLYLSQIQSILAQHYPDLSSAYSKARQKYLEKAYKLDESNFYIRFHLGIAECQLGKCKECVDYLQDIITYPGVTEKDRQLAKQYLLQCGASL